MRFPPTIALLWKSLRFVRHVPCNAGFSQVPLTDKNVARWEIALENFPHRSVDFRKLDDEQKEYGHHNHPYENLKGADEIESGGRVVDDQDRETIQNGEGATGKKRDFGIQEIDRDRCPNDLAR
jgi:hypothetical protein